MERRQVDPRVLDWLLSAGTAIVVALVIAADLDEGPEPTVWAYLFAFGFGALMVLRRRVPRTVLTLTVLGVFVYYAIDLTPIGITLPAMAALYSAAEQNHTRWAVGAGAALVAVAGYFLVVEGRQAAFLISYEFLTNVALVAAAVALGVSVRARRESRDQQRRIADLTAAEHAQEAQRRVQAERFRLARDVHDLVGHTLSVVSVHANVAEEALGPQDEQARQAVRQIQEITAQTMSELRATVRLLRSPEPATHDQDASITAPGLGDVPRMLRSVEQAGIRVDHDVDVDASLSQPIAAAAHRIIQESLTNVIKHAGASAVLVSARESEGVLRVEVRDDGSNEGQATTDAHGAGIAGMVERARLLGGEVTISEAPEGGFRVSAELPARLEP